MATAQLHHVLAILQAHTTILINEGLIFTAIKMTKNKRTKKNRIATKIGHLPQSRTIKSSEDKSVIELVEYQITDEPIDIWNIPKEIEIEVEELFNRTYAEPETVIPRIKELIGIYPNVPQLYNYLSVAYSRIGEHKQAEEIVEQNYKINPKYLFAKLNYAEICLQKKEFEKIPEIFEGKFDIKALYPHRDIFHLTEVIGFWGVTGLYFAAIGKNDTARLLYNNLKKLVPGHPYTNNLKQHFLFHNVKNSFNKLISKKQI